MSAYHKNPEFTLDWRCLLPDLREPLGGPPWLDWPIIILIALCVYVLLIAISQSQ